MCQPFDAVISLCQGGFGLLVGDGEDEAVAAGMVRAVRPGGRLALCGLSGYCREVVEITHLDQLWSIYETRDEAVQSLKQA